jgi:hypothetical protein
MRKALIVLSLLMLPVGALAQETPKYEVFMGYSNFTADFTGSSVNMNGVNFSAAENVNSWFGGALDFSTHYGTDGGRSTNTQSLTYGPVFSYRRSAHVVPFVHALLGVDRGAPEYLGISKSELRFGVYGGAGVDVKITERFALRLIQADYLMTRFSSVRQDNMRLSAGVVLRLGKK